MSTETYPNCLSITRLIGLVGANIMNRLSIAVNFRFVFWVLNVIIMGGCSQIMDDVSNDWLVYRNETYGYSFSYPPDCKLGPVPDYCKEKSFRDKPEECLCFLNTENPNDVQFEKIRIEKDRVCITAFSVSHFDMPLYNPPPGIDLVTWLKENLPRGLAANCPDDFNANVGGVSAVEIHSSKSPMAYASSSIFFLRDNRLFRVHLNEVDNEVNKRFYFRIIKSFQFEER